MSNDIIRLEGIDKLFPGTKALDGVSFSVRRGEAHAICGENGAGKSTLMNIIAGVFPPTAGRIFFEGEQVSFVRPMDAQRLGIALVHQEISLCPHLSVAENIFMGRLPATPLKTVDWRRLHADTQKILDEFGEEAVRPRDRVGDLNIAQQQMVEIMKALSLNCKLLILDEPTSSLTELETENLFGILRRLLEDGISILYISHRLSEISQLCHRATVLRDGSYIGTREMSEIDSDDLISMMVGRQLSNIYPPKAREIGGELFHVEHLFRPGVFRDVSFSLRRGEILGFCGLIGAGRTEVARAACGIDKAKSGRVFLDGQPVAINSYGDAIRAGIVYMSEDRKEEGLFLADSIRRNISAAVLPQVSNGLLLAHKKEAALADRFVEEIKIKVASIQQPCSSLSGGNQQKVLLSKWLAVRPKVFIVDEPTRGIDVGVKLEVYKILRALADSGVGIIVITSDLPEAIGICDRVIVMRQGVIAGEAVGEEINETDIMRYASQV